MPDVLKKTEDSLRFPGGCCCLWWLPDSLHGWDGEGGLATNEERQQAVLTPEEVSFRDLLCISAPGQCWTLSSRLVSSLGRRVRPQKWERASHSEEICVSPHASASQPSRAGMVAWCSWPFSFVCWMWQWDVRLFADCVAIGLMYLSSNSMFPR